jgi:hypothetical protein
MVYLGGCATNPSPGPSTAATLQPAVTAPSSGAGAAKAKEDAQTKATKRYAREMGYHVETHGGEQLYCRYAKPIGQLIEQKECLSYQVLEDTARDVELNKASWHQPKGCSGSCDK